MSEFKLTGPYYISEWNGNSLNDGTNPDTPYAHPADVPVNVTSYVTPAIIGSGFYEGNFSRYYPFVGDGKVVADLLGLNPPITIAPTGWAFATPLWKNIEFLNGDTIDLKGNNARLHIVDCYLEFNFINPNGNGNGLAYHYRNIIKGASNGEIANSAASARSNNTYNCIFLSNSNDWFAPLSTNSDSFTCQNTYFPKSTTHFFSQTHTAGTLVSFLNNCINSIFILGGAQYELKQLIDGSPRPDANPAISDIVNAPFWADIYTRGNFASVNEGIIDLKNKIVSPGSDLLKKANTYGFIGGVLPGKKVPVNSSDANITIATTDINTSDPANYLIQSPATEGFINILWKLSNNISEVQKIFLDALLSFDGSDAGGSVGNNNVPDNFPASYSPLSQAGLKPNRLLYELRTSQSIAKPTIDAEWDNDNAALGTTVGAYYRQEWNTKPMIVTALGVRYGNGSPESIGGTANGINARWAQAKIRLTNNRAF